MKKEQENKMYHYIETDKRRYRLREVKTYTIGRNPDRDIFLSDPAVSRMHAHVVWEEGAFVISDNASTNGTYLNGEPVTRARLSSMDSIRLGKVELFYSVKSGNSGDETLSPDDSLLIEHHIQELISEVKDPGLKARFGELIGLFSTKKKNLSDLAFSDGLTGLMNRLSFDKALIDEWKRRHRYQRSLSLMMIDIDHFKKVNDNHGHQKGDSVLKTVAAIVHDNVRSSDYACRYGGEELAVILPETTLPSACITAEKLRGLVERQVNEIEGFPVTISLGVASYSQEMKKADELVAAADKALYRAKREGRNRVVG